MQDLEFKQCIERVKLRSPIETIVGDINRPDRQRSDYRELIDRLTTLTDEIRRPDTTLIGLARYLLNAKIHRALVMEDDALLGIVTAFDVLNLTTPPWYYRTNHDVWLGGVAPNVPSGSAGVNVSAFGNGTTSAEWKVSLTLDSGASSALYGAAVANGGYLDAHFQSATCANDILSGRIHVPEPADFALVGMLALLLGLGVCRRHRSVVAG